MDLEYHTRFRKMKNEVMDAINTFQMDIYAKYSGKDRTYQVSETFRTNMHNRIECYGKELESKMKKDAVKKEKALFRRDFIKEVKNA